MTCKLIPFPCKQPPNFSEFPDGYDAAIIFCALAEKMGDASIPDSQRSDIDAILDRISTVEQAQIIEWRYAFQCCLQNEGRP
jgi:hypothetical protein